MLKLYIANKNYSSWSLRPWVLMQTLGIPFTEQLVPLEEGSCWEKYRDFSPNGLVPCLHDDKTIVWESLAITEYLAESYPEVWPTDKQARAWARSATSEMHAGFSAIRNECGMSCGLRIQLHDISPALQQNLKRLDELWTEGLGQFGGPFLAGEVFTAVDAFFAPVVFRIQTYQLTLSSESMAYVQRILNLESMRSWYAAAMEEPWRESHHERECLDAGVLISDLRKQA